jgi:hypothetical protein
VENAKTGFLIDYIIKTTDKAQIFIFINHLESF